jgi:hypothetical protein
MQLSFWLYCQSGFDPRPDSQRRRMQRGTECAFRHIVIKIGAPSLPGGACMNGRLSVGIVSKDAAANRVAQLSDLAEDKELVELL